MESEILISQEKLLSEFLSLCGPQNGDSWSNWSVRDLIMRQPPVNAMPVIYGRWVKEKDRRNHWHCSECGFVEGITCKVDKFCPKCGAIMSHEEVVLDEP